MWKKVKLNDGDSYGPEDVLCCSESTANSYLGAGSDYIYRFLNPGKKSGVIKGYANGYWVLRNVEEENEFGPVSP